MHHDKGECQGDAVDSKTRWKYYLPGIILTDLLPDEYNREH